MIELTPNYNLKKPGQDDFYDVADQNSNMEIIDGALNGLEENKGDKINYLETPNGLVVSLNSIDIKTSDLKTGKYYCFDCTGTPNDINGFLDVNKIDNSTSSYTFKGLNNRKHEMTKYAGSIQIDWKQISDETDITTTGEANKLLKFSDALNTIKHIFKIMKSSVNSFRVANDDDIEVFNVDTVSGEITGSSISALKISKKIVKRDDNGDIADVINLNSGYLKSLNTPDLNTLTSVGMYYCYNPTNNPTNPANKSGYLFVSSLSDLFVEQTFTTFDGEKYFRTKNSGNWEIWKNLDEEIGVIKYSTFNYVPTGYLKVNGAEISRTTYANLFSKIGVTYGIGDGINTFNLPDLRGVFIRGLDEGRGLDSGRVLGSYQEDMFQNHLHDSPGNDYLIGIGSTGGLTGGTSFVTPTTTTPATGFPVSDGINGTPKVGAETRPKNISLMAIIKY